MPLKFWLPGIAVVIGSLLFATDAFFREKALTALDPAAVGFLEHGIAFVVLLPWVFVRRRDEVKRPLTRVSRKDILLFAVVGIGGSALGTFLFSSAVEKIGAAASLFTMAQPIFVLGFAWSLLGERFSSFFVPGAIWVVVNMVLLGFTQAGDGSLLSIDENPAAWEGIGVAILATIVWAGSTVAGKSLLSRYSNSVVLIWRWGIAFATLGLLVAIRGVPLPWEQIFSMSVMLPLLYLGVVAQTVAFWIYYVGLRRLPASLATFIELLYPLVGMFIPIFASGRPATPIQGFAGLTLLVAIGLLLGVEYPRAVAPSIRNSGR